jgi:hypothetical protein
MLAVKQRPCAVVTQQSESTRALGQLARAIFALSLCTALSAQTTAENDKREGLHIVAVEGDGAINNVAARTAHEAVIKVLDRDGNPVPRAVVTFTLPSTGAGAAFLDGQLSSTSATDAEGVARTSNLTPNKTAGQFPIRITASANGETAHGIIYQTNAASTAVGSPKKKIVIATVVAGAVAGGVLAATRGKGGSTPSTSTSTVVAGPPTFVPPK